MRKEGTPINGQNPNQQLGEITPGQALSLVYRIAEAVGMCLTVFARQNFGPEYPGASGLIGLGILLAVASKSHDPAMMTFFWLVVVALILQKLRTWQLVKSGARLHSRYNGYPWLIMKFPRIRREDIAKNVEISLCMLAGITMSPMSKALGGFIVACSVGLAITRAIDIQVNTMRVRRMRDAELEQRYTADLFRGKRNDY